MCEIAALNGILELIKPEKLIRSLEGFQTLEAVQNMNQDKEMKDTSYYKSSTG